MIHQSITFNPSINFLVVWNNFLVGWRSLSSFGNGILEIGDLIGCFHILGISPNSNQESILLALAYLGHHLWQGQLCLTKLRHVQCHRVPSVWFAFLADSTTMVICEVIQNIRVNGEVQNVAKMNIKVIHICYFFMNNVYEPSYGFCIECIFCKFYVSRKLFLNCIRNKRCAMIFCKLIKGTWVSKRFKIVDSKNLLWHLCPPSDDHNNNSYTHTVRMISKHRLHVAAM